MNADRRKFLAVLHADLPGARELRAKRPNEPGARQLFIVPPDHPGLSTPISVQRHRRMHFASVDDLDTADAWIDARTQEGCHVWAGVATRREAAAKQKDNALAVRFVFADVDFKMFPGPTDAEQKAAAAASLNRATLRPSIVILSGHGAQCYWRLTHPIHRDDPDWSRLESVLDNLAGAFGADPCATDLSRVLRVPGTRNFKYDPPRDAVLDDLSDRAYSLDDIEAMALELCAQNGVPAAPLKPRAKTVAKAVGQGSRATELASAIGKMHRDGWPEDAILAAALALNRTYDPPLADREVEATVRSICSRYAPAPTTYAPTDTGNAKAFAAAVADCVRWDYARRDWLVFAGPHWRVDADGAVDRLLQTHLEDRLSATAQILEDGKRSDERRFLIASQAAPKREACLRLTRSQEPIADRGESWDLKPDLFGAQNVLIDLETGKPREGTPTDRVTRVSAIAYDPRATCPRFDQFIAEIFASAPELADYTQRVCGYLLTGHVSEQKFFVWYGTGSNGKSVLSELLHAIMGPYAYVMPFPSGSWSDATSEYQKAELAGRRFVSSAEVSQRGVLNEEFVKSVTGSDTISARRIYGKPFNYSPTAKFVLKVNDKPIVRDDTHAMWRRLALVPFRETFPTTPGLAETLRSEAAGVLAWMVRGGLAWRREGLCEPTIVRNATDDYRADMDPLAGFLAECCVVGPHTRVAAGLLYQRYAHWADRTMLSEAQRLSPNAFGTRVAARFQKKGTNTGHVYVGVGLLDPAHTDSQSPRLREVA